MQNYQKQRQNRFVVVNLVETPPPYFVLYIRERYERCLLFRLIATYRLKLLLILQVFDFDSSKKPALRCVCV